MLFNSIEFLFFVIAFFALWPLMRKSPNLRWTYLIAFSLLFYGWWDWRYLFLLMGTATVDFLAALGMERFARYKKLILLVSLGSNLGCLGLFKYADFAIRNANWAIRLFGGDNQLPLLGLILPIGISSW